VTVRRLAAAAVVAAAALLSLAPAGLAQSVRGGWTSPEPRGTYQDTPEGTVTGPQLLVGYAEHVQPVTRVSFVLVEDAAPSVDHPCSAELTAPPQEQLGGSTRVDFAFEASFPCNRRYLVRATPHTSQGPQAPFNLWVAVAIPPTDVEGVRATAMNGEEERGVSLRWEPDPAPPPDFEGYEIRRAIDDGDYISFAEVEPTATSFVDRTIRRAGGRYRYQVFAMRPGPDGSTVYSSFAEEAEVELPSTRTTDSTVAGEDGGEDTEGTSSSGSGGGSGGTVRHTTRPQATAGGPRTATTIDSGYQGTLPFQPGEEELEDGEQIVPDFPGDRAVVAEFEDDGPSERDTLLLVAGGSAAFMWAMVLRVVSRRAAALP
jgi:hypothetical protein